MTTPAENAFLCEVEPGKPMHEVFKRYWLPLALGSDVAGLDSDPMRVTALCEDYVLFRDSDGKLGLLRENCCHRGASLCLGRVEESGIRCIYHGWKFAVDGTIQDMPNCPDDRYKSRYRQPAYPVREAGGLIWGYLGPADKQPPFPDFPFLHVPDSHRYVEIAVFDANYIQVMEGGLDTSHLGILHADALGRAAESKAEKQAGTVPDSSVAKSIATQKTPRLEVEDMPYGFRYAAIRPERDESGEEVLNIGVTAFALPSFCFLRNDQISIMALPVTSGKTHFFHVFWDNERALTEAGREEVRGLFGLHDRALEEFGLGREWHGRPGTAMRENNFLQNREAMRRGETFTGIMNFLPEDAAVVTSAGVIFDRRYENLIPADVACVRARRLLVDCAHRVGGGENPIGVPATLSPRGTYGIVKPGASWQSLYDEKRVVPAAVPT